MCYNINVKRVEKTTQKSRRSIMTNIIIFIALQFTNVVLSTIRSICTINSKPAIASTISAISYTFYYVLVKFVTEQDLLTIALVTFFTNLIGVWLAKWIMVKLRKDKLWIYGVTYHRDISRLETVKKVLTDTQISYQVNQNNGLYTMQIFSYSQKDSRIITELLKRYNVKYYAVETKVQRV
jgi:hypothetical protein